MPWTLFVLIRCGVVSFLFLRRSDGQEAEQRRLLEAALAADLEKLQQLRQLLARKTRVRC
jgi:hypothetical protein